jgi:hypothetical protein
MMCQIHAKHTCKLRKEQNIGLPNIKHEPRFYCHACAITTVQATFRNANIRKTETWISNCHIKK